MAHQKVYSMAREAGNSPTNLRESIEGTLERNTFLIYKGWSKKLIDMFHSIHRRCRLGREVDTVPSFLPCSRMGKITFMIYHTSLWVANVFVFSIFFWQVVTISTRRAFFWQCTTFLIICILVSVLFECNRCFLENGVNSTQLGLGRRDAQCIRASSLEIFFEVRLLANIYWTSFDRFAMTRAPLLISTDKITLTLTDFL